MIALDAETGAAALALPDRAPRHLGLRRAVAADAGRSADADRHPARLDPADQARRNLRARPCDGSADQGGHRAAGAAGRHRARRTAVADPAVLDRDAVVPRSRQCARPTCGASRRSTRWSAASCSSSRATKGTLTPGDARAARSSLHPGYAGGINWGSVSIDVDRGIMIANWMRLPSRVELIPRAEARGARLRTRSTAARARAVPRAAGRTRRMPRQWAVPLAAWHALQRAAMGTAHGRGSRQRASDLEQAAWHGRDSGPFGIATHLPITDRRAAESAAR